MFFRELDFIRRQEVERKKLEEVEKAHLVEVQGLQVRVSEVLTATRGEAVLPRGVQDSPICELIFVF